MHMGSPAAWNVGAIFLGCILAAADIFSQTVNYKPVVETYSNACRVRSGIAMGGLGTGSVELRKDGQFYNWTIFNNWPLGTGEPVTTKSFPRSFAEDAYLFFLVRYQVEGGKPEIKLLQLNNSLSEAGLQSIDYYYPWMSAVDKIEYQASFPFTGLTFTDPGMPFVISLEAFSPFIPHDNKNSSLPGCYFNFRVTSKSDKQIKVFLIATLRNLVGYDKTDKYFVTREYAGETMRGFSMSCAGMDTLHSSWGSMGLYSLSAGSTCYLGWEHKHPYYEKLLVSDRFPNLNDTENRNHLQQGTKRANFSDNKDQRCFSSVGISRELMPGNSFDHSFVLSWFFPNQYGAVEDHHAVSQTDADYSLNLKITGNQGHYYSNFFSSDYEVAHYFMMNASKLRAGTLRFTDNLYSSSLPRFVLDQVNSQLNTFISSSTYTRNGHFGIREGLTPEKPWGPNATIDVSLYGSASIIALFPELQKNMMRQHQRLQTPLGEINHGLGFDLENTQLGTAGVFHRIDLVPNYIQMVIRDFFWTGDTSYLREMWPSVKKGIDYILNNRDADGDSMPEMKGIMCSYDNFPMFGLASYIQSQWLAAMASVKKAAPVVNDDATERLAESILSKGMELMNVRLWNGQYFDLSNDYLGDKGRDKGVLTDQLVGQWVAHQSGLGYIQDPVKIKSSLQTILDHSFTPGFGLRNCTWPEYPDLYPIHETELWVDQANTCWSGVELAFASLLIYEGMTEEGLAVIKTVNDRYRRSGLYWDHQEFGGHYYRPLSAWSILHAFLGLGISCGNYAFNPHMEGDNYRLFFSHGNGTAHYLRQGNKVMISVRSGRMTILSLELKNSGISSANPLLFVDGKKIKVSGITHMDGVCRIQMKQPLVLMEGSEILIQ
jgi:uncharacterized protein (DUF608 family)